MAAITTLGLARADAAARAPRANTLTTAPRARPAGHSRPAGADPRIGRLAERLRAHLAGRLTTPAPPALRPGSGLLAGVTGDPLAALRRRSGGTLRARLRPRTRTPRYLAGARLEPATGLPAADRDLETARAFLGHNRRLLRLAEPSSELALIGRHADPLGGAHLRFGQRHDGLEVWPAELVVHLDGGGNVVGLTGVTVPTPAETPPPVLDPGDALALARAAVPEAADAPAADPELILWAAADAEARLAWRVVLDASLVHRWVVVVDASDGDTLARFDRVTTMNLAGAGADVFGAMQPLNVWLEDGVHYLVDTSKPMYDPTSDPPDPDTTRGAIMVFDARNQPPTDDPEQIPDAFFITAPAPTGPWLADGVSAASAFAGVYDYYRDVHARDSLDGEGGSILALVRVGQGYGNAAFLGDLSLMIFGDAQPFAGAVDVVAHELTHGVTANSARLVYQDQPGALNESFSDVFGVAAEARILGRPADWLLGDMLGAPLRNMQDPGSLEFLPGRPYPERLSEFVRISEDNGGVHINSSIINHAFYELAEGLPDAVGLSAAERIFYRALTVYLTANSQFVDARLGCVQAATDLFGAGSPEATRTGEAFDAVEIFDGEATPPPPDIDPVDGTDALLFLFYDQTGSACSVLAPDEDGGGLCLGRREPPGDPTGGVILSQYDVAASRPSIVGDGSLALFVDTLQDVCLVPTNGSEGESCFGLPDDGVRVASVAVSPSATRVAVVLLDDAGTREPFIAVIDVSTPDGAVQSYELAAPASDGTSFGVVRFADAMAFTADDRYLVYDALSAVSFGGAPIDEWSIFALELATGSTLNLVPPVEGLDIGFPSLGKTNDRLMLFDVVDSASGDSTIYSADLTTGDVAPVIEHTGFGVPSYVGDDRAFIYTAPAGDTSTGFSLRHQALGPDRRTASGAPALALADAAFGVSYRRGVFTPPVDPACSRLCAEVGGREKLRLRTLGRATGDVALRFDLGSDGSWRADLDDAPVLSGSYQAIGKKGRKLRLALDDAARNLLLSVVGNAVGESTGVPVDVGARGAEKMIMKLVRKGTQAKVKLVLRLAADDGSGKPKKGSYVLRLRGGVTAGG